MRAGYRILMWFRRTGMKRKKEIAVLGFGSQGRALALNLRDSGYNVKVGLRPRSKTNRIARENGFKPLTVIRAAEKSDLIIAALPDHKHNEVLNNKFFASLETRPPLVFLHGASIHFDLVNPPQEFPVLLLAPHAPGLAVRDNYLNHKPYSAFYAVHQGSLNKGREILFELARAIGIPQTHLIKTDFKDEAIGDIFGEQAVLCGGLVRLLKYGFETLVEGGLPPDNAYLEVAYQIDLIVTLIKKHGLEGMFDRISPLARYGSAVNGSRVVPADVKKCMKEVLKEIEKGQFIKKGMKRKMKPSQTEMNRITNKAFDKQARKFSKLDND